MGIATCNSGGWGKNGKTLKFGPWVTTTYFNNG